MKKVLIIIVLVVVNATSTQAQQVCRNDIRPSTPTVDFTEHSNGTVTNERTGLMWKKCLEGQSGTNCDQGNAVGYTWKEALQSAEGHIFAGYTNWRLPNIKELTSIIEESCVEPAINLDVFPDHSGSIVWSASPFPEFSDFSWYVHFQYGNDSISNNRAQVRQVRLVRGGQ